MRIPRRWLLAVVVGVATFLVVMFWPVTPRWAKGVSEPGRQFRILDSLTPNQRLVVEESGESIDEGTEVVKVHTATGQEVSRFHLPAEDGDYYVLHKRLVPGGEKVFVVYEHFGERRTRATGQELMRERRWVVLDVRDGKRLAGPFPYNGILQDSFSPDGRWVAVIHRSFGFSLTIHALDTGEAIVSFPSDGRIVQPVCCFSPDSKQVAVLRLDQELHPSIGVYECPSGKERIHFDQVQGRGALHLRDWQGDTLMVHNHHDDQAHSYEVMSHSLGPAREEPQLKGWTQMIPLGLVEARNAGERVVRLLFGDPLPERSWLDQGLAWIDEKFETQLLKHHSKRFRVQVRDKASWRRLLEVESPQEQYFVPPDASWLAVVNPQGELEVWDVDRGPRWPWALAAGVVAGMVVPFIRRPRSRQNVPMRVVA